MDKYSLTPPALVAMMCPCRVIYLVDSALFDLTYVDRQAVSCGCAFCMLGPSSPQVCHYPTSMARTVGSWQHWCI